MKIEKTYTLFISFLLSVDSLAQVIHSGSVGDGVGFYLNKHIPGHMAFMAPVKVVFILEPENMFLQTPCVHILIDGLKSCLRLQV